ncbi:MAG: hypothetical protein ACXW0R_01455 [Gaiellaceae bacterium]
MIRGKRIIILVATVASMVMLAAGGASVATAFASSSKPAVPKGANLNLKNMKHELSKAERHRAQILQRAHVTTRAQAYRLLRALGVDPRHVVIQLGKHNYAGLNCPGKAWTCTKARRVLQASGDNEFQCTPASDGTASPYDCFIVQTDGGSAKCVEKTKASGGVPITQRCTIVQGANPNGDNRAEIVQSADQKDNGDGVQDVTQIASVMQNNGTRSNSSSVQQDVKQSFNTLGNNTDPVVEQSQEAHQYVSVIQDTNNGSDQAGNNDSKVSQSQNQDEQAEKAATSITQLQNTDERFGADDPNCPTTTFLDDPTANECYAVSQTSNFVSFVQGPGGGNNTSTADQKYNQSQHASKTLGGQQAQGSLGDPSGGGTDHRFIQNSSGVSSQDSKQDEHQTQQRNDTGAMTWEQHGPRKGTGTQDGNANSNAKQDQNAVQDSKGPGSGFGTEILTDQCHSDGNCAGTQRVDANGDKKRNSDSGQNIAIFIACGNVDIFPPSGDFAFARVAADTTTTTEEAPPPCTPGTFGD